MDQITKSKLEKVIEICNGLINDEIVEIKNSEIELIPKFLDAKSVTSAKKEGLILKRGAKHFANYDWQLPNNKGRAYGKLYLGSKFKKKNKSS